MVDFSIFRTMILEKAGVAYDDYYRILIKKNSHIPIGTVIEVIKFMPKNKILVSWEGKKYLISKYLTKKYEYSPNFRKS